jgi:hypothetical protein
MAESVELNWVAFMIDVDPDEIERGRTAHETAWVRIPGKHRNRDSAWAALEDMLATRH